MAVSEKQRPLVFALRALGLGDFLVGVPAYRALRRAYPDHEIRLATTAGVAPLARFTDAIDSVSPARAPDDFAAPGRPIDVAVNLHGRGPRSTTALRALKPRRLLSFDDNTPPRWDDDWPGYERARWCELLAAYGIAANPDDFRLRPPDVRSPAHDAVVVHPGAAFGSRRWPADRFAEVARALRRAGHDVVVTGARGELRLAIAVAEMAGLSPSAVFAGKTDVLGLAALIARAELVVSGDTGPAHLATAYKTPSVVLFGPTPPARWGPPDDSRHIALWPTVKRSAAGDPHGDKPDPALLAITAPNVVAASRRLLATTGAQRSEPTSGATRDVSSMTVRAPA
jgi:ADP-heptose:LPS heptosyltransferase